MKKLQKLNKRLSHHEQQKRRGKIIRRQVKTTPVVCNYKPSWWTRLLRFFLIRKPAHE